MYSLYRRELIEAVHPDHQGYIADDPLAKDAARLIHELRRERDEARAKAQENAERLYVEQLKVDEARALLREVTQRSRLHPASVWPDELEERVRACLGDDHE